jgi:hypothetical protein
MIGELGVAWRLAKGYRLHPWASPYLRWRVETWSGLEASHITPDQFLSFCWKNRRELRRYLHWAAQKGG